MRKFLKIVGLLVLLAAAIGIFVWYQFFRDLPQPASITDDPRSNFLYGSIGGEGEAGIPYWIIIALPQMFPEYLPGPGGYASLGLPWEAGQPLPMGFSKKTIGFERVAFNCAICHSTRYRLQENEAPTYVAAGGSHTADIQGLLNFFSQAANDPRFNATNILTQIDLAYKLNFVERMIYRFVLIPLTKKRLIEQGAEFGWAGSRPDWGPGRDAPMNLTKFNFLHMPMDDSIDNTDFPSIWYLKVREGGPEKRFNLDGASPAVRTVLIDSALGIGGTNTPFFHKRMAALEAWLKELPPPAYPEALGIDQELAARGEPIFRQHCAACHAIDQPDNRMGTVIALDEVGTDRERADTWTQEAARLANEKVASLGIQRDPMGKFDGYVALPLTGLWLKGPYLHNGAVPTVRDLLNPPEERPKAFYRGYDVLDADNVGFVSQRCATPEETKPMTPYDACTDYVAAAGSSCVPGFVGAKGDLITHQAWCLDTTERGNGNGGHLFGTDLPAADKDALVEYLKTL
jgi:mono/diheme cytochrome c family protein